MRTDWLTGYGPSNLEALLILVAMGVLVAGVWWWTRERWRSVSNQMKSVIAEAGREHDQLKGELDETERQRSQLQSELAVAQQHDQQLKCELIDAQTKREKASQELTATQRQIEQLQHEMNGIRAKYDPMRIRELQDQFHTEIAHEFAPDLDSFVQGCKTTADRLRADQVDLRVLQNALGAKADNMKQHCRNIVGLERLDRIPFTLQAVNLIGLIQEVVADLAETYADFLGVRLELAPPPKLPTIWVNKDAMREVYRNIVRNAINASRSGDVVCITVRLEDGDPPQVIVDVHNDGRVIPPESQAQLFELHRRGVGLPYSLRIVRLHRGDLALVRSKPGEGTLFRIILPYGEPDKPPSSDKESETNPHQEHSDSNQPTQQDEVSPPVAASRGEIP